MLNVLAGSDASNPDTAQFASRARAEFNAARTRFQGETNNAEAEWRFGRACYDLAEFAKDNTERSDIAQQGIAACRRLIERNPESAPGHYYLAMNLGQLARTKSLGALKIVEQIEQEFKIALSLDPQLDYAGPYRGLGLLYLEAPGWPTSIGSRGKSRQHLQRALRLSPNFPENRLNLIQADLKWGDTNGALRDLKALNELWPAAQKEFAGDAWAASWAEWKKRRDDYQARADEAAKPKSGARKL